MSTPQTSEDVLVQDRLAQLNVIVNRRNEFLRELFCLLRSREDIHSTSIDDEDEGLGIFLKRFDLRKGSECGSIFNLTDDEISFPVRRGISPRSKGLSSTDVDNGHTQVTSTRTTRSRARAEEVLHSFPPEKSKASSSEKTSGAHHSHTHSPLRDNKSENMTIDTDEDNDELDLIGPSAFFEEGKPGARQEASTIMGRIGLPGARVEVSMSVDKHSLLTPGVRQDEVGVVPKHPSRTTDEMDVEEQKDPSKHQEPIRDKDDAIDAEEMGAITKPSDAEVNASTVETKFGVSGASVTAAVVPDDVHSQQVQAIPLPPTSSVASPLQATPIGIQQVTPIPIPSQADDKLPQLGASEEVAQKTEPTSRVDNYRFNPSYPIPPLTVLPADFTKKAKSIKRKKDRDRDKEREKEKERESKRDKDDNVPMGLSRWAATLMANPLWRKVSRANKTLNTHDWSVAMTELRLVRTIERIDLLKNDGRWSFRQPKKQRSIGGSVKSHWDHLLDEMKWMRTDFREERRWKLALAYNLSTAVLEWHYAQTAEERQKAGIVVKWKYSRTHLEDENTDSAVDMSMDDVDRALKPGQLLGLDYDTEEEEEEEEEEEGNQGETMDPLEPSVVIRDALDSARGIQPKDEEMEDQLALQLVRIPEDSTAQPEIDNKLEDDLTQGLKSTSENPLLIGSKSSSQSINGDADPAPVSTKPTKPSLAPLRQKLVHSDDLFFDLSDISTSLMGQTHSQDLQPQHLDLQTLFSDLQPFGLLDVSPNRVITNGETKKRSEKKSDRDDPTKRAEDLNYTKLFSSGRFMHTKPTLIGPLQPAKRFKDEIWLPIDPQAVAADMDGSNRVSEDVSNDLFEGRPSNASSSLALQFHASSLKDKDARRKGNDHLWTASDDAILKQLVDRYSTNWALITECYNASRLTTPTERRTPADCAERWKERWSAERKLQLSEPSLPVGEDGNILGMSAQNQMTTRAVKRLASVSVSSGHGVNVAGEKKRRRHYLLQESIKRAVKKRADAIKTMANQRKPPAIHETHTQYNNLPRMTPLELARMKADKDQRESHDIQLARRRQEEAMRQNLLREQAQRGGISHGGPVPHPQNQQQQPQAQTAQIPQPQVQQGPTQQTQQALTQQQQQQLAHLQQLQAQQQANQPAGRANVPGIVPPNRQTRLATGASPNGRPINSQAQAQAQAHLLQQVRAMQVPMQLPPAAQANLAQALSQAQAAGASGAHLTGNPYYSLPSNLGNLTQEQILNAFALQSQHSQQQQQSSQSS